MSPPTAIVLLNLGGPETLADVEPFLRTLFADRELLRLPWQSVTGDWLARLRAPKVRRLYAAIGGGSPILRWTRAQGDALCARLDRLHPSSAPHRPYIAFRYARPRAEDALRAMAADGVQRAVAFTQYPQFSCTTTGSSLNDLWATADRLGLRGRFAWSVLDRWPTHDGFVAAMADTVRDGLARVPVADRDRALVVFSAHSLPLRVIDRGDAYPAEVAATVERVRTHLGLRNPWVLSYQSKVGPVRWLGPQTEAVVQAAPARGARDVVVVPIAFTSDHIETLSELDIELAHTARSAGVRHFVRAPALNDRAAFTDALAGLVAGHLRGEPCSPSYPIRCAGCRNPACRRIDGVPASELPKAPPLAAIA
jgi:ferrochelatase